MKNLILIVLLFFAVSCESIEAVIEDKKELYEKTDSFVESLQTTYQSYGLLGGIDYSETTSDGLYKIHPVGRLINVRIERVADTNEYEELREDLEKHYDGDPRVNDVYICGGGTVMIDCRN